MDNCEIFCKRQHQHGVDIRLSDATYFVELSGEMIMRSKTQARLISVSWSAVLGRVLSPNYANGRRQRRRMPWIAARACCLAVCAALATNAPAAPILLTHTGTGSGTIDDVPFADADFTIMATGLTENRMLTGPGFLFFIDHDVATIEIDGVGTLDFVTGTRTFVSQNLSLIGFSRAGGGGSDLFNGPTAAAVGTWDMLTSIGPIIGTGDLVQWADSPMVTDEGVLVFFESTSIATFQAVVVPEPASLWLMLTGVFALRTGYFLRRLHAGAMVVAHG